MCLMLVLSLGGSTLLHARDAVPAVPDEERIPIALLIDATSGQVLFERNADRRFVPASITKVMTTYTAFELIKSGQLQRSQSFTVRPDTFRRWRRRGSTMYLSQDARVTVEDLLRGITTVSANDGSVVLAEGAAGSVEAWTRLMNAKARELGMADSYFANPNGWMDEGKTFVTARDLTLLASGMIERHPMLFAQFVGQPSFSYNGITQNNRDPMLGEVRGAEGIKTGFTYQAGFGFLGTAKRQGRRLIMVVGGADSSRERRDAARSFMEWGFDAFENRYLYNADQVIGHATVQNGDALRVGLVADKAVRISIPSGFGGNLASRIEYQGPLRAPIKAGEEVATLVVYGDGVPEARIPLEAETDVSVAGPLDRVVNAIWSWIA